MTTAVYLVGFGGIAVCIGLVLYLLRKWREDDRNA